MTRDLVVYEVLGHGQVCTDGHRMCLSFRCYVGEVTESLRQDSRKTGKSVRLMFLLLLLKDHVSLAKDRAG